MSSFGDRIDENKYRYNVIFNRSIIHLLCNLLLCQCYTASIIFIVRIYLAKVLLQKVCGSQTFFGFAIHVVEKITV